MPTKALPLNANLRRKSLTFAREKEYLKAKAGQIVYFHNFIRTNTTLSKNPDKNFEHLLYALG
jgi:hypothetical protein